MVIFRWSRRHDAPSIVGRILMVALGALAVAALCPSLSAAQEQEQDARSRQVDDLYAEYGPETPGVSIRVLKSGKVVHRGEYGMASLEYGIEVSPSTVFAIGSNSKQFTGLAIAMLAEKGRIDLDADVRSYVPEVPHFGETITVRHLVHHTSGIRDWVRPLFISGMRPGDTIAFEQVLEFLKRQKELNFSPGEQYMYSNTGYNLLAEVIHRVTETPFAEWMAEQIFTPLKMANTRIRSTPYDMVKNMAASYYPAGDGYLNVPNGLAAYGSCCVLSTTDDLVKWFRNFETGKVGGREVLQRMTEDTVEIDQWDGRLVAYGSGLMGYRYHGHAGFFHSGQWAGFRSATLRLPSQQLDIVVLSNAGPSVSLKEWEVLDIYAERGDEAVEPKPSKTLAEQAVALAVAVLDRFTGTYNLGEGELAKVTREEEHLVVEFTGDQPWPLTAVSNNEFKISAGGRTLRFETDGDGAAQAIVWREKRSPRAEPFQPDVDQLREFTGTYHCAELDTTWRFEIEDNTLLVATQIRWGGTLTFTPTVKDEFRGRTQISVARFVRDDAGKITGLKVSGRRARNIQFVRLDR